MENKALLIYQKLRKRLGTVEAIISRLTLHEINQRSDYLKIQLEGMHDIHAHVIWVQFYTITLRLKRTTSLWSKELQHYKRKSQKLIVKTVLWMGRRKFIHSTRTQFKRISRAFTTIRP